LGRTGNRNAAPGAGGGFSAADRRRFPCVHSLGEGCRCDTQGSRRRARSRRETDPFDTHPPLKERIAAVEHLKRRTRRRDATSASTLPRGYRATRARAVGIGGRAISRPNGSKRWPGAKCAIGSTCRNGAELTKQKAHGPPRRYAEHAAARSTSRRRASASGIRKPPGPRRPSAGLASVRAGQCALDTARQPARARSEPAGEAFVMTIDDTRIGAVSQSFLVWRQHRLVRRNPGQRPERESTGNRHGIDLGGLCTRSSPRRSAQHADGLRATQRERDAHCERARKPAPGLRWSPRPSSTAIVRIAQSIPRGTSGASVRPCNP
jgi:hypothetical protein